ncbi:MAG TPA: response regulator [Steroidobacteraceae bacterium]
MSERTPIAYIVDDDEVTRSYFNAVLSEAGLTCCLMDTAASFLETYDADQPGCLLLDIRMPGMTGMELQHQLNLRGAIIPVIFITAHAEIPLAVEAIIQGAFDFLQKPISHQPLLACVRKALAYDESNRDVLRKREQLNRRFESLTGRERQVLTLLVAGHSNKVMADELHLSPRTIELHRAQVMEKTGCQSLAQLVRMAMQLNVT